MSRNGYREVCVKTIHGSFPFAVQRLGSGAAATNWLELSGQLASGQVSAQLAEFSTYYANRLSYAGVAELLARLSGEPLLSAAQIQQMALEKAAAVARQWAAHTKPLGPLPFTLAETVDFYAAEAVEILVLCDAICVKQQKAQRRRKGTLAEAAPAARATVRVNTDVWLVERACGGFEYLTAGVDELGQELVSVEARVQQYLAEQYGKRPDPLLIVARACRINTAQIRSAFQPIRVEKHSLSLVFPVV